MDEWRKIADEPPPSDAGVLLIWGPGWDHPGQGYSEDGKIYCVGCGDEPAYPSNEYPATHWAPMLPPPEPTP